MKKQNVVKAALLFAAFLVPAGCGSIASGANSGARDGVSQGVAGLFNPGRGSTQDRERAAQGCGSGDSPSGSSAPARQRGSGENVDVSWPSASDWDAYGLRGLRQPARSTVESAALFQGAYMVSLYNAGQAAYDDLIAQIRSITGVNAPYSDVRTGDGRMTEYQYGGRTVSIFTNFVDMETMIRVIQ